MRRDLRNRLGNIYTPYKEYKGQYRETNLILWRAINGIRQACACIYKEKSSGKSGLARSRAEFHASCVGDSPQNWQNYTGLDEW